jgi:hypothetical protein
VRTPNDPKLTRPGRSGNQQNARELANCTEIRKDGLPRFAVQRVVRPAVDRCRVWSGARAGCPAQEAHRLRTPTDRRQYGSETAEDAKHAAVRNMPAAISAGDAQDEMLRRLSGRVIRRCCRGLSHPKPSMILTSGCPTRRDRDRTGMDLLGVVRRSTGSPTERVPHYSSAVGSPWSVG